MNWEFKSAVEDEKECDSYNNYDILYDLTVFFIFADSVKSVEFSNKE